MLPEIQTVFAGVRSPRVAVLLDSSDRDWQESCRRIIECLSCQWGGKNSIIIPTDGRTISTVFWSLLDTYDPDYVISYQKTARDILFARPTDYEALRDSYTPWSTGEPWTEQAKAKWEDDFRNAPYGQFGITPTLEAELRQRLAPFYFQRHVASNRMRAHVSPDYPFTTITKILAEHPLAERVDVIDTASTPIFQLWVEAVTGGLYPDYETALAQHGVSKVVIHANDSNMGRLFDLIAAGKSSQGHGADNDALLVATLPFAYSMLGLSEYLREPPSSFSPVVVCGSDLADFALYYALARLRPGVSWLPSQWVDEFTRAKNSRSDQTRPLASLMLADGREFNLRHFGQALWSSMEYGQRSIRLLSATLSIDSIREHLVALDSATHWAKGGIMSHAQVSETLEGVLDRALEVFNTNNYAVPVLHHVSPGKTLPLFQTPKPKGFTTIVPGEHRWLAEVKLEGLTYPRHPALGEWLVQHPGLGTQGARTARNGLSYFCPSPIYFTGGDVDTILIRPTVYLPDAEETIERLANAVNWTTRISDKGSYSRDTLRKFGGIEQLSEYLRTTEKNSVLHEYLKPKPSSGNQLQNEKYLSSDQRWYLEMSRIQELAPTGTGGLVDFLISHNILHRGFVLKCQSCRNTSWFPLADLTDQFRCKRCRREQNILYDSALQKTEPVWHYALDEIVYQGLRNDMVVPILALDHFRRNSRSFQFADELEIRQIGSEKPFIEIDLCCIVDGRLTIGEAKTTSRIAATGQAEAQALRNYRDAAVGLGAEQFVIATSKIWACQTIINARTAFQDTPIAVLVLNGADLLRSK